FQTGAFFLSRYWQSWYSFYSQRWVYRTSIAINNFHFHFHSLILASISGVKCVWGYIQLPRELRSTVEKVIENQRMKLW
ncbi:hypothetical protein C0J52_12793, partial [Blattella germanica]